MQCNINNMIFTLRFFNDVALSFGANTDSAKFFRGQLNSMVLSGQISDEEADIVLEVIGMKNTDAIKWDVALKKVADFTVAASTLNRADSLITVKEWLKQMRCNGGISDSIERLLKRAYGI